MRIRWQLSRQDVALMCTDGDRRFAWFTPSVSHIRWERLPVMRRVQRWADNISRGKEDKRQAFTKAEFAEGGKVGAVWNFT
ncbi:hypothetical protein HZ994_16980 [Akkermansiaceae bacterium]|nr:hypothetical protein HZ994_16980 [Akkermansiaceae bacterium]